MALQQEIAFEWNGRQVGRTLPVLLDAPAPDSDRAWIGRTWADAPDVDGLVFVTAGADPLAAGNLVDCEIVAAHGYDLIAVAAGPPR